MNHKIINIELARIIAILFVVTEHVISEVTINYNNEVKWTIGLLIWSFIKINVPVFLILIAHFSFGEKCDVNNYFIKKLKRIIIPLVSWSLFYYCFLIPSVDDFSLSDALAGIIQGGTMYHLYFMYWFIGFCFFFPLINLLHEKSKKAFALYFVILLIATSLIPTLSNLFNVKIMFFSSTGISSFGFLLIYAFVPKISEMLNSAIASKFCPVNALFWFYMYILSVLITFLVVIISYYYYSIKIQTILNGGSFFIFISAFAFYNMTLLYKPDYQIAMQKIVVACGSMSFGVYLIHPVILQYILELAYRPVISKYTDGDWLISFFYVLFTVFIVFFTSLIFTYIISKVKYVRKCMI